MSDVTRQRAIAGFLQDSPTPEATAAKVAQDAAPAVIGARAAGQKAEVRPESMAGDYPWRTEYAAARQDLTQQIPIRLRSVVNAKLQFLLEAGVIRSKAGFIGSLVVEATNKALVDHLIKAGMTAEEAQLLAADPAPIKP